MLGDLDAELGRTLRLEQGGGRGDGHGGGAEAIQTVSDEIAYWSDVAATAGSMPEREKAMEFRDILAPLGRDFDALAVLPWEGILELMERTQSALDEAWCAPPDPFAYPEARMLRLIEVMGGAVAAAVPRKLLGGGAGGLPSSSARVR